MSSKFFDIPFRTRSFDSDFSCKDGEILFADNANLSSQGEILSEMSHEATPPCPDISFALVRDILKGWHINPDVYPSKTLTASEPSLEYWTQLAAQLLHLFQTEAMAQNLFVAPFYVIAAWKTTDGLFLSPTSPVLMIPNSSVPIITTDIEYHRNELDFKIAGTVCSLFLRLKVTEKLRDLVGKISSLEIFTSTPLHSYNSFLSFVPQHRLTSDSWCRSLDITTGEIADRRICTETLSPAWKASLEPLSSTLGKEGKLKYHRYASIPLSEIDLLDEWQKPGESFLKSNPIQSDESISYDEIMYSTADFKQSQAVIIEGKGENIEIETRPLKLTGAGAFKQIRRIFLRGHYTPSAMTVNVYASRDMLCWWKIAKGKGGTMVILPRSSFRFYKVQIQGFLSKGENLQGFTIHGS